MSECVLLSSLLFKLLIDPSIVFVHGLHDRSEQTWQGVDHSTWPQHLLPQDIPFARISTFGFSVIGAVDKTSANDSSDLCQYLEKLLEQDDKVTTKCILILMVRK